MKKLLTLFALLLSSQTYAAFDEIYMFDGKVWDPETKAFKQTNYMDLHVNKKEIVLTFDDGPTPNVTQAMLKMLAEFNIRATFFCLGNQAAKYPEIMHLTQADGHIVGNHSKSHSDLTKLGDNWQERLYDEVIGTHLTLRPFMYMSRKFYLRAPSGAWNPQLAQFLNTDPIGKQYTGPIQWDVGGIIARNAAGEPIQGADWACWSNKWSVDDCLKGYIAETVSHKGGVVLMHDLRMQSVELARKFIQWGLDNGYKFVTMDKVKFKEPILFNEPLP